MIKTTTHFLIIYQSVEGRVEGAVKGSGSGEYISFLIIRFQVVVI